MVRLFGLVRGGAPKYAQGLLLIGEHRVSNHGVGLKLAARTQPPVYPHGNAVSPRSTVAVA
jgi:hypothetical protein